VYFQHDVYHGILSAYTENMMYLPQFRQKQDGGIVPIANLKTSNTYTVVAEVEPKRNKVATSEGVITFAC